MTRRLIPVVPSQKLGRVRRWYASLAATRAARAISRWINWRLDPVLLRLSNGRVSSTLWYRSALLETVGARTGHTRRNAVIYFNDCDDIVVTASNAGAAAHPSWYYNLLANPDVTIGGVPKRAVEVAPGPEKQRLEALSDQTFPAFASYRADAEAHGRSVPVIRLVPPNAPSIPQ